jgi:hypothetical protein
VIEHYTGNSPITWPCFTFAGQPVRHFISRHNTNLPPFRMTERSIELALADLFLDRHDRDVVVEIGATTPYYWPHRIATVIDPTDKHALVTVRDSFTGVELAGRPVLSISTFEHIGLPDYGLPADQAVQQAAVDKLLTSAGDFLVTTPGGYNPALDKLVGQLAHRGAFELHVWSRPQIGNEWQALDWQGVDFEKLTYGPYWANTLLVWHRGPPLLG